MRVPTPNEIEIVLGLPTNSLSISFSEHGVTFNPSLSSSEEKITLKLLEGVDDDWVAEIMIATNWQGFEFALNGDDNFINYGKIANEISPFANSTLITKFNQFAKKEIEISEFAGYFEVFCQIAQVTSQHRNEWAYAAQQFNLSSEFVAVVSGN